MYRRVQGRDGSHYALVHETLLGVPVIRAFNREERNSVV